MKIRAFAGIHAGKSGLAMAIPRIVLSAVLLISMLVSSSNSQVSRGGKPATARYRMALAAPVETMPSVDRAAMLREDSLEASKGVPFRFGVPNDVNFTTENSGAWETLPDGSRMWRLRIECPGAFSTNLLYDNFWLPHGAELFIYNGDQSMILGAFTEANNKTHGKFATGLLKGDVCIIEYREPANVAQPGIISINRVVHAYRNLFDEQQLKDAMDFGSSGSCNNNVNCPEGAAWQNEKRSVALITTQGGFRLCSGALVNNVRQDLKPYLLTANHCLGGEASWVFIFNYESPNCSNINGPTWMSASGSTLRSTYATSDFALLELSEAPPDSYNVYFAGWSAVDIASTSSVGIHHPSGDIKKISFDNQASQSTSYLGSSAGDGSHWRIVMWDDGTTEPGSSGSPLFDQNHRITGQLHGGYASCASLTSDWYGKFARSWNGGGSASNRLRDWLDPDNTGTTTLNGRDGLTLLVNHSPLPDTADTLSNFTVLATIETRGTLVADSALLHYEVNGNWSEESLTPTGNPDEYSGVIPSQPPGTTVHYFLTALNSLGDRDTTLTFTFSVIGHRVDVSSVVAGKAGIDADTLQFDISITNKGSFEDSFDLSLASIDWSTEITDTLGLVIYTTPALLTGESYPAKVRVIIGPSQLGDVDSFYVIATSIVQPSVQDSLAIYAISEGAPLALPFTESFTGLVLDESLWAYGNSVTVSPDAANLPSAPYALQLDGYPTGADTIVTRPIDLSLSSGAVLTYYYEDGGFGEPADAGDDLIIDYLDVNDQWQSLFVHPGANPTMPVFDRRDVLLPAAALHKKCRIRFRSFSQVGDFDHWFVDDISIAVPAPAGLSVPTATISKWLAPNDSSIGKLAINNTGGGVLTGTLSFTANAKRLSGKSLAERGIVPRIAAAAGGPDAFGYTWKDSDNPGGPSFVWQGVSPAAVDIVDALNDDNVVGPFNLGFSFPWYGILYSQVYFGSNGLIGFGWPGMESSTNIPFPNATLPNNLLGIAWKDLDPDNTSSGNAHVYIDTANGVCVISLYIYPQYQASAGGFITAQIILSPDGSALLQYNTVGEAFSSTNCTVGFENQSGTDGLTIAHFTNYLHSGLAIKVSPPDDWFALKKYSFSVPPGSTDTIPYEFDATGLDTGVYTGTLAITSNDPMQPQVTIPIELSRPAVLPFICGDINNDHNGPNVVDLTFLVAYIFGGGVPPTFLESADVNNSGGNPNVVDIAFLVQYLFNGGATPNCP